MSATTATTRASTAVRIWSADHYTGSRISRRGWQASIIPRGALGADYDVDDVIEWCDHSHRTIEAAKACGRALWRRLA